MKKAATYLLVCAGVLLSHHANAKNDIGSGVDSYYRAYNQGLNNRINAQRAYIDAYINGVNARNAINQEHRNQALHEQQVLAQQKAKEENKRLMSVYYATRFFNVRKQQLDELKLKNRTVSQLETLGTPQALTALGIRYEIGYDVPESKETAVKYYQLAAQKNLTIAQSNLGGMYLGDRGVEPNYTEAIKYLTLSANKNYPNAIISLAGMYRDGTGVPKDLSKATELYKQAAAKGDSSAAFALGLLYASESSGMLNYPEALYWSKKAAISGDALAMKNLTFHYYNGFGVSKNYAQAYFYSILATANGLPESESRDSIEKQLTRDEVLKVQAAANKWNIGEPLPNF